MKTQPPLECKVTKWFWWRAWTMFILLAAMSLWFLRDWKIGYPQKNYELTLYESFQETRELFKEHLVEEGSKESWANLITATPLTYPEDRTILPEEHRGETLPPLLADYDTYYDLYETQDYKNRKHPPLWKEFTAQKKWDEEPPKAYKEKKKINEQLYFAIGTIVLAMIVLGVMLWMRKRSLKADESFLYLPGGKAVAYPDIVKIDKRKWDTKGLATLYYQDGEEVQKVRIDGMIYGQFSKAEDEPAERLFQRVLGNFKGELVELVDEEEVPAETQ